MNGSLQRADPADAVICTLCKRAFALDEDQVLVMQEGRVMAVYHESCRPDRRRKGCGGC